MTRLNKKYFVFGLILSLVGGRYYVSKAQKAINGDAETSIFTSLVEQGDLQINIKVLGQAELVDEQTLRFNQLGKVTQVYFSEGDRIEKDDLIAELDKTEINNDIQQAEINLQNSQIKLQDLLDGNTKAVILKAQNDVDDYKRKLDIAYSEYNNLIQENKDQIDKLKTNIQQQKLSVENLEDSTEESYTDYDKELELAEKDLEEARKSYELAKNEFDDTISTEEKSLEDKYENREKDLDDAMQKLKTSMIEAQSILEDVDKILGLTDAYEELNDDFEQYLGVKNTTLKNQAETSFLTNYNQKKAVKTRIDAFDDKYNIDALINILEDVEGLYNGLFETTDLTYQTLDNSAVSSTLSQSAIDSYKSNISSSRSKALSYVDTIKSIISQIKTFEDLSLSKQNSNNTIESKRQNLKNQELSLEKAEDTVRSLKENLDNKKVDKSLSLIKAENDLANSEKDLINQQEQIKLQEQSKKDEITNMEINLEIKLEDLEDVLKGYTDDEIKLARNDVVQKQLSLEKTKKKLENYELIAPFSGIVRKMDIQVGDNLVSDDKKYVYLENPDLLEITIMLDQIDVVKVKEGLKVEIEFDAYPGVIFEGTLGEVDATPIEQSGVVSYEVKAILDKGDKIIYSGMTTSCKIILDEKNDVLLVPSVAIQEMGGKKYVQKQNSNGQIERVEVKTGITDGKNTEIVSGLELGDTIFQKQLNLNRTSTVNKAQFQGGSNDGKEVMRNMRRMSR